MMHINTEWENTGRLERESGGLCEWVVVLQGDAMCTWGLAPRWVCLWVCVCAGWPADSGQPNREREKEGERPAQSLAKAKFSILNTFHICAAPPIVVAECRCRSAIWNNNNSNRTPPTPATTTRCTRRRTGATATPTLILGHTPDSDSDSDSACHVTQFRWPSAKVKLATRRSWRWRCRCISLLTTHTHSHSHMCLRRTEIVHRSANLTNFRGCCTRDLLALCELCDVVVAWWT